VRQKERYLKMSYETALTIDNVINFIHKKKYLLPSIQREFVWDTYQISKLFDSIMRDYPINSFLFWKVEKNYVKEFEFYEFLREYHEKNQIHNPKANVSGDEEVIAVLDGQQRLTALYISLKGTYAYKEPYKRWNNESAYPKRKLYINLLKESEDPDFRFSFDFLTKEEARNDETHFWFSVSDILDMKELDQISSFLIENELLDTSKHSKKEASFANQALSKLYKVIHVKPLISYYLEQTNELDKVLNIFIRINSGGTILSYSDLLLSIATAQWEQKDAREEILSFVDEINNTGEGFNFSKDFVLKASLVLSDFPDIAFKVDNFKKSNMITIEQNWDNITKAIRLTVNLISSFGFSRETLSSANALIPIAYYLKKIGLPDNYSKSSNTIEERRKIQKWLVLSLLKKAFSGQPDNVLRPMRSIINESTNGFPFAEIINKFKGTNKSILFSKEDIENLVRLPYGKAPTFSVLSLLYPSFDFRNIFHQDHIHPKSLFTKRLLKKRQYTEETIDEYIELYNLLPNLQLLEDIPNIEKQDTEFKPWLEKTYKNENELNAYKEKHFIPAVNYEFDSFLDFFKEREKLLVKKLTETLTVEGNAI
jgi:uncharacterized protein with ParB-like and HNH nuclease domain